MKWAGRTVLVGRGTKGSEVALRLPPSAHQSRTEHLRADPRNGVYAVDLGKLSSRQYRAVARALRGAVVRPAHAAAKIKVPAEAPTSPDSTKDGGVHLGFVLPGIVLLLLIAGGLALWLRPSRLKTGE